MPLTCKGLACMCTHPCRHRHMLKSNDGGNFKAASHLGCGMSIVDCFEPSLIENQEEEHRDKELMICMMTGKGMKPKPRRAWLKKG